MITGFIAFQRFWINKNVFPAKTSCNKMFYCVTTDRTTKQKREAQTISSETNNLTLQSLYSMEYYHRGLRHLMDINNNKAEKKRAISQGYDLTSLRHHGEKIKNMKFLTLHSGVSEQQELVQPEGTSTYLLVSS